MFPKLSFPGVPMDEGLSLKYVLYLMHEYSAHTRVAQILLGDLFEPSMFPALILVLRRVINDTARVFKFILLKYLHG